MIGQTVGHYRITSKIGSGGMGEVYRATDTALHRDVAVKVIAPEFANDRERMARFEREAQVLASLTHGSIAAVYGLEQSDGHRALVMELVEGEDLSARLKRGPMPLDDALRAGARIAEALEAAHEHGVIHRDLKPANIKLLDSGHVKLLDFGLAKALDADAPAHLTTGDAATLSVAATRAGVILGTAAYMSPEQATAGAADKRSDVWSFGVVLFEMLTGGRLFDGQTTSHVLADVIRGDIDFARLPSGTPADVRTLLERCLERDPRRRLRDIREARLVLERSVERGSGAHTALRSGPALAQPAAGSRRAPLQWAAAGALLAAIVASAAAWTMWPSIAAPKLRVETAVPGATLFAPVGSAIELSPDGGSLAMAIQGRAEGTSSLVVRRLNELKSVTLLPESGGNYSLYNPFFSSDGAWVGYAVRGELRRVPVTGGTPLKIVDVQRSRGASWGADGTVVFAATPNSGLSRVPATGGQPQPLTTLDEAKKEATHRWPQVLPDGKSVLFTVHTSVTESFDKASLEIVDIATGNRRAVLSGGSYGRYVPSGHIVYVANNTLFAVPFDLKRKAVTGPAVPVVQEVTSFSSEGSANFTFGSNGLMTYMHGAVATPRLRVAVVGRDGTATPLNIEPGTYGNPRLSPDGKRLSLTVFKDRNWDIWVYDLERQVFTRITFDEGLETEQVWSPDGRELAYSLDVAANRSVVYRKRADGSGSATQIAAIDDYLWPSSWSPDGRTLIATSGKQDIAAIALGESKTTPNWLVQSSFAEADGILTPNGRYLAYTSAESGRQEVYVRQFPSGGGRWQVSRDGGSYPRWSKNGKELFYRTAEGVMAVPVKANDATFENGTPHQVVTGDFAGGTGGITLEQLSFADYDASADGSRFVMLLKPADSNEAMRLVTLVTDWFDDLRRATGGH